jgi:uncharacterized membrane protein (UPF0127 family)
MRGQQYPFHTQPEKASPAAPAGLDLLFRKIRAQQHLLDFVLTFGSDKTGTVLHQNIKFPIDICWNDDLTVNTTITKNTHKEVTIAQQDKFVSMVIEK